LWCRVWKDWRGRRGGRGGKRSGIRVILRQLAEVLGEDIKTHDERKVDRRYVYSRKENADDKEWAERWLWLVVTSRSADR
jgi:hypothetical protein